MKNKTGPRWLDEARKYIGLNEIKGPKHNRKIIRFWEAIKAPFRDDETPWCAGFVGGILEECGIESTRSAAARSYLNYGVPLSEPAVGAIVIFWRGNPKGWSGHVGFITGVDKNRNLMVLGGNQGDAVNIKPFSRGRVLGYRWPGIRPYKYRFDLPVLASNDKMSSNEA